MATKRQDSEKLMSALTKVYGMADNFIVYKEGGRPDEAAIYYRLLKSAVEETQAVLERLERAERGDHIIPFRRK